MKHWRTSVTGILSSMSLALAFVAQIPYTMPGNASEIIPPEYKAFIFKSGFVAWLVLGFINSLATADSRVETPLVPPPAPVPSPLPEPVPVPVPDPDPPVVAQNPASPEAPKT
jgi:hypothetical protein